MFGFVYEDCNIEKEQIEKYLNLNSSLSGLMILSGGCTMFEISKYFDNGLGSLTAIDFNQEQVNLVKNKINLLENEPEKYNQFISQINMPFDNLFQRIKNSESFDKVFSTNNLISQFGESAVINTQDSFVEHFENVYNNKSYPKEWNWIWGRNLSSKNINEELTENLKYIKKTNIVCGKFEDLLTLDRYDFIQTSNLTDWMDKETFDIFCEKLSKSLKQGGILIMRRLLSDNILIDKFPDSIKLYDKTNFYKETICYVKK